jgi:hypothetical protein
MGYGLDTEKYADRKWGTTISWRGEAKGKLQSALDIWQRACGIIFSKVESENAPVDFTVKWGSTCSWHNDSKGNGKPASGKEGVLNLKESASLGTVLHEIGHLLGCSHEQDHPDGRGWFSRHPEILFGREGAELRAEDNTVYHAYDENSIMHYPQSNYANKSTPTESDITTAKGINGWE